MYGRKKVGHAIGGGDGFGVRVSQLEVYAIFAVVLLLTLVTRIRCVARDRAA
jgi:hypothetical protein